MWKLPQWVTKDQLPTPFFAFTLLTLVTLFQIPASFFIHKGYLSLGILLNEWGVLVGGIAMILALAKIQWKPLFPFQKVSPKSLGLVFLMTIALCIMIDDLTFFSEQLWPLPQPYKDFLQQLLSVHSTPEMLWKWFLLCITPAFCEEFFFRGMLQGSLTRHIGAAWGIGITAFFFALIHGNPWYFHLYLLLGFYLCWLLWVGKNLWFPILAHFINNSWTYANHLLHRERTSFDSWTGTDSLLLIASLAALALLAFRFKAKVAE